MELQIETKNTLEDCWGLYGDLLLIGSMLFGLWWELTQWQSYHTFSFLYTNVLSKFASGDNNVNQVTLLIIFLQISKACVYYGK